MQGALYSDPTIAQEEELHFSRHAGDADVRARSGRLPKCPWSQPIGPNNRVAWGVCGKASFKRSILQCWLFDCRLYLVILRITALVVSQEVRLGN